MWSQTESRDAHNLELGGLEPYGNNGGPVTVSSCTHRSALYLMCNRSRRMRVTNFQAKKGR